MAVEGCVMFKTRMTELLGIKYPIMQGGMQNVARPELAAAVSRAGGLGTTNVSMFPDLDEFRSALKKIKSLTDNPFAINISLLPDIPLGDKVRSYIKIAAEEGVKALETAGANPAEYVPDIKASEMIWIHKAPSFKHAVKAQALGADFITAAGFEVGGHPGRDQIGSIVLTNKAANHLNTPVLAAGGFADGNSLAAALSLGAAGIVMGTRFLAAKECYIHQNFKDWILNATENDTLLCQKSINNMFRAANNGAAVKCLEMEAQGATLAELMTVIAGKRQLEAYDTGDIDGGIFAVGNAIGLINDIKTVQEIMDDIITVAHQALSRVRDMEQS